MTKPDENLQNDENIVFEKSEDQQKEEDNKQLEEYSRNSRTRYDELFTDKLMITKIEQVYHQLLRSSK